MGDVTTYQQHFNLDDGDADSICNELVYPPVDGGFYSDAGYQSPDLSMDQCIPQFVQCNSTKGLERLHKPIPCPLNTHNSQMGYSNIELEENTQRVLTKGYEKKLRNIDMVSNNKYHFTYAMNKNANKQGVRQMKSRHSKMKSFIEDSDLFFIPPGNTLPLKQAHPEVDIKAKEENISPVTISSGYSSDKDEAIRQLDFEYTLDEGYSSMHGALTQLSQPQASSSTSARERNSFIIRADELYDSPNHYGSNKVQLLHDRSEGDSTLKVRKQKPHCYKKSKENQHHNKTNSLPVTRSHSLDKVNKSLANLTIHTSDFPIDTIVNGQPQVDLCKTVNKRPASIVSLKDVEKLPEMLPAGVRTSFTNSSGILMAPEASRCSSRSTSARINRPSPDLSLFRVSKNSAFRPVNSMLRSNSTPPDGHISSSLQVFRNGEGCHKEGATIRSTQNVKPSPNFSHLLSTPSGSRVASLSDSGRGSASSIDLALNALPPLTNDSAFSGSRSSLATDSVPIYQDIAKEEMYEPIRIGRSGHSETVDYNTPPKLPRRNTKSRTPRSRARKTSDLVKYEDIVKPQDIVDPSAMHMYTVADVLNSVDLLSSNIPQSNNDICIHDDFTHFVFGNSTPRRKALYRSASQHSVRDNLELSIVREHHYGYNERDESFDSVALSSPRGMPRDLNMPLRLHQNTACEAQTKKLPKTNDAPDSICDSPCLKNKLAPRRSQTQYKGGAIAQAALKSATSRTAPFVGHRARSRSLVRSRRDLDSIAWSSGSNMTEVYC